MQIPAISQVLWKGIKESTELERSAESGGQISLHLANLPNIGWLVNILADAYRLLLEQAGLAAKLATELPSARGSIPDLPDTVSSNRRFTSGAAADLRGATRPGCRAVVGR